METLVVGTDFSKQGNNAVEYAANLAKYFSAKLIIVNAFKMPLQGYDTLSPMAVVSELQRYSEDQLNLLRDNLISRSYDFGLEVYSHLGTASSVLEDAATKFEADMVIVGMTGEGSILKEKLIGSNATLMAKQMTLPLLIIPERVVYKRIRRISLACDLEKMNESVLIYSARYIAKLFDAELELVTVQPEGDYEKTETKEVYSFIEKHLETLKHKHVFLKDDDITLALEYYFKFHDTDLVMVNPKKQKFIDRLFKESVTKHLVYHSERPLLVIH